MRQMTDAGHQQQSTVQAAPRVAAAAAVKARTAQIDTDANQAAGDLAKLVKAVTPAGEIAEDAQPPTVGLLLRTLLPGQ
jgi:hypothetical protein